MDQCFHSDGFCVESPSYSSMHLSLMRDIPEILRGYSDPQGFQPDRRRRGSTTLIPLSSLDRYRLALESMVRMLAPERRYPVIGDTHYRCGAQHDLGRDPGRPLRRSIRRAAGNGPRQEARRCRQRVRPVVSQRRHAGHSDSSAAACTPNGSPAGTSPCCGRATRRRHGFLSERLCHARSPALRYAGHHLLCGRQGSWPPTAATSGTILATPGPRARWHTTS